MNIEKKLNNYYELTRSSYTRSTNDYHEFLLNNLIKAFKRLKVTSLELVDIKIGYNLITYFKEQTKNNNNSINRHIRYLRKIMLFNKLYTSINDLPLLPSDTKPFKRFYHDELKLIIQYINNLNSSKNSLTYKTFIRVLLDSGIRQSEAINLKLSDIDFHKEQLNIYSGKTRTYRLAPFSEFSKNQIKELIARDPKREFLFYNFLKDRPISRNDIKQFYKRLKKNLNLERIHSHRFRKTFGSMLIENGMAIEDLQQIFDHSRITTTMMYVQMHQKKSLDAYKKFNDWGVK